MSKINPAFSFFHRNSCFHKIFFHFRVCFNRSIDHIISRKSNIEWLLEIFFSGCVIGKPGITSPNIFPLCLYGSGTVLRPGRFGFLHHLIPLSPLVALKAKVNTKCMSSYHQAHIQKVFLLLPPYHLKKCRHSLKKITSVILLP